jgi:hypothetical protein
MAALVPDAGCGCTIDSVRKLVTWTVVTLGVAALVRRLRRRREQPPVEVAASDPAAELRRKLDESRAAEPEPEASIEASVEDRRADVHDQGRAALDEMHDE